MTRSLPSARLLSVSAWRALGSGEANGDIVIAVEADEKPKRIRLAAEDVPTLVDALTAIRASELRRALQTSAAQRARKRKPSGTQSDTRFASGSSPADATMAALD